MRAGQNANYTSYTWQLDPEGAQVTERGIQMQITPRSRRRPPIPDSWIAKGPRSPRRPPLMQISPPPPTVGSPGGLVFEWAAPDANYISNSDSWMPRRPRSPRGPRRPRSQTGPPPNQITHPDPRQLNLQGAYVAEGAGSPRGPRSPRGPPQIQSNYTRPKSPTRPPQTQITHPILDRWTSQLVGLEARNWQFFAFVNDR